MTDTWTWATVTQASPLRIKVDGDTSELDATTDNLVGSLAVDDRVRVHLHSDGLIVTGIQGGGNRSNPNLLINSDFMVNQRGAVSGATIAAYAYFLDGWYNPSGTSSTLFTWADVGGVRTFTLGGGGTTRYVRQKVEQANLPAGTYTLSWEGTARGQVMYVGGTDPGYSAGPITVYLNGTATVIIGFRGTGDTLRNVKLEQGSVATPYQPPKYDDNLRACERYYVRRTAMTTNTVFGQGSAKSTTEIIFQFTHPVMRAAATMTFTNMRALDGTSLLTVTAMVIRGDGPTEYTATATVSGATTYRPYMLQAGDPLPSYIAFSAEL